LAFVFAPAFIFALAFVPVFERDPVLLPLDRAEVRDVDRPAALRELLLFPFVVPAIDASWWTLVAETSAGRATENGRQSDSYSDLPRRAAARRRLAAAAFSALASLGFT
jgi:hypothetical protein